MIKEEFKSKIKKEYKEQFLMNLEEFYVLDNVSYEEYLTILTEVVDDLKKLNQQGIIKEEIKKIERGVR